ncbi:MAG: HDOD domain-containing protein [Thermodesulfobacteriota bacterium]
MMSPIGWPKKKPAKDDGRKRIVEKGTTPKVAEAKQQERESIFKGLDEKELNTLYSMANILKMKSGDYLYREGDIDQRIYVILEGRIKIIQMGDDRSEEVIRLSAGTWMGETAFARSKRTNTAVADSPASVMALDKETINSLEKQTQLYFYKRLNNLSALKLSQLENQKITLQTKNARLADALFAAKAGQRPDLERSEVVKAVIQKIPRLPLFVSSFFGKMGDIASMSPDINVLIAELTAGEQQLVDEVMKKINSSYFAFPNPLPDINAAVSQMGFQTVYRTFVAEAIRHSMPDLPDLERLHAQSVTMSYIAFAISGSSQKGSPVQVAIIGLLYNIGQLVMALLKNNYPGIGVFIDTLDHSQIGTLLVQEWDLPESVCQTVEYLFHPDFVPPSKIPEEILEHLTVLYMARLCHDIMQGKSDVYMPMLYYDDYRRLLKWDRLSPEEVLMTQALPYLRQNQECLPAFLRQVLDQYQ